MKENDTEQELKHPIKHPIYDMVDVIGKQNDLTEQELKRIVDGEDKRVWLSFVNSLIQSKSPLSHVCLKADFLLKEYIERF